VAGVAAAAVSDRAITVRWAPAVDDVGVKEYQIRSGKRVVVLADPQATSFQDDGLLPATRHCYTVVAEDAAGNASPASEQACAVTPDLVPPTAPPKVAAYPRSGTQLALAWEAAKDDVRVEGYEVLRDGEVVAKVSATQALVADLEPETEYCVAVRAFDPAGNRGTPTNACGRTADAKVPGAPWNVRAATTGPRELSLTWDPSPDPGVVYVVYWDGSRHGERPVGTTPRESFKIFGNPAVERHCYRIVARSEDDRVSPSTRPVCASAKDAVAADERPAGAGGGL
jgi:chitodextrinase